MFMKKIHFVIAAGAICCIAFKTFAQWAKPGSDPDKLIVGEWRNIYLKLIIHHKNDAPQTMEADSSNWEARLHIKPIRTHFQRNGSYYSEYFNLKDSLVRRTTGIWTTTGDSIIMTEQTPDKSVLRLHLKIENNVATFNGLIDFDGEGISNDEYYGMQRKFK
jgi:hypothetical protein